MGARVLRQDVIVHQPIYRRDQAYLRAAVTGLVVAVASYLSARAGLALSCQPGDLPAFWPPAAVLLVALLMTRPGRGWVVVLTALPAQVIAVMQVGKLGVFAPVLGLLSWLGAWTATVAFRRVKGEPWRLADLRDFYLFTLCAVIGGPVVVASAGTALQVFAQGSASFWASWRVWFLANALVHLTLSPTVLLWVTGDVGWLKSVAPRRYGEACLLSVALLAVGLEAFGGEPGGPDNLPLLLYTPIPMLLWAAVRFGPRGAATALSFIACLSIWYAVHGRGPFTEQSPAENVLALQLFLIVVAVSLLVLAILIEERRRAQEALRESEVRFRIMADTAPVMIWISALDTGCTFFNKPWLDFTGRTMVQELGNGWAEGVHPKDVARCFNTYRSAFKRRQPFTMEYRLRRADGEYRWVVNTGVPRVTPEGTFTGYIGSCIDITERKLAEEQLRASEERYRTIVEEQTELICRYRPDTTLTFVNEAYCRYFGRAREELIGQSFLSLIPDEARQTALEHVRSLCEHPRIERYEHPVIGTNGETRWQQWVDHLIVDDNGHILELQAAGRDITERKQAEEALRRAEAMFRAVFEANFVPLCFWHEDGRILEANDAYLRLTDFSRAELEAGQLHWDELTLPEEFHLARRSLGELAAGRESSTPYEKVYRLRDGRRIPVWLSGALLTGYTDRGVAYAIDLSERKQAEAALQKAQAELAHVARVVTMGELAASLAHELNQPLTAILSNAQAAQRFLTAASPDLDEVRAILADIVADDRRAGEVIHRLHRLLRRGELERLPLDLNEVLREVVRLMHSEVIIKNVTVSLELGADLPPVPGDRVQLQQVILNLLINSVEAMSAVGDRSRELLIRSCRHGTGGVLVAVRDAGIGLDPQHAERMFDSFYTTKPKGMGLGLSISRSIVEAHGGRLWAAPNEGYGTTIQFTLSVADEPVA